MSIILISCDNCGVVLDKGKLDVPNMEDYEWASHIPLELFEWDGDEYQPTVECPCCKERFRVTK